VIRHCFNCNHFNPEGSRYCAKCGLELWLQLLALLEQADHEQWVTLNLSEKGLSELPPEIEKLSNLVQLDLRNNQLNTLPPEIGNLSNLNKLALGNLQYWPRGNRITRFPKQVANLSNLIELDLRYNLLTSEDLVDLISVISQLHLISLNLRRNKLTSLPVEIAQLKRLKILNLSNNQLKSLPKEIALLADLTYLDLSSNWLDELPTEIGNLSNLKHLDLSALGLAFLPPEVSRLSNLSHLNVSEGTYLQLDEDKRILVENHLKIPGIISPSDDFYYSIDPKFVFSSYFGSPLNEAKLLLVGVGGVGKTSLVRRLVDDTFDIQENITQGIDVRAWLLPVNDHKVRLHMWDFGGQEIYHATHQFFFTHRSLYLLVLDARQGNSESQARIWLDLIQSFGGDAPVIIVVNKIDQHREPLAEYRLRADYPAIRAVVYTSCYSGVGIPELQAAITTVIATLPHVDDRLPKTWYEVKEHLQALDKDVISYDRYEEICADLGVADPREQRRLLRLLHDLGTVLNFQDDPRLEDTSVLNPNWVTQAVYRILTVVNEQQSGGVFALRDLRHLLDQRSYPTYRHRFLLDLMYKFELCFPLHNRENQYLIPALLPKEEPALSWPFAESLAFALHYHGTMPDSIFSRFMVRKYTLIEAGVYWRSGVVLAYEGSRALVQVDAERKRLHIWITGEPATRRLLLTLIRAELADIHASFEAKALGVNEMVPLPGYPGQTVPYRDLLNAEKRGMRLYYLAAIDAEIDVQALLNGIETPQERELSELRRHLLELFNLSDLHVLCFELGIDYEEFPATKSDFVLGFLRYVQGNGRLEELLDHLRQTRPHLVWQ